MKRRWMTRLPGHSTVSLQPDSCHQLPESAPKGPNYSHRLFLKLEAQRFSSAEYAIGPTACRRQARCDCAASAVANPPGGPTPLP